MKRSVRGDRSWWTCMALLCVGYACYSACGYGGAVSSAYATSLGVGLQGVQLARTLLVAATGIGCISARSLEARGISLMRPVVACFCYGVMAVCTLVGFLLPHSPEATCLLAFMMGLASAVPLLLWFEGFLIAYEVGGPSRCLVAIAVGSLLGRALGFFSGALQESAPASLVAMVLGLAVATACQVGVLRGGRRMEGAVDPDTLPRAGTYRLTVYMVMLVASFGVTSGIASSAVHYGSVEGGPAFVANVLPWAAIVACGVVVLYAIGARRVFGLHFGQFIRLSLVAAGVVFAFLPLMREWSLGAALMLYQGVGIIQGIAMTLLSIEISYEKRLRMVDVMPMNYIVYVVCTCIAMEVPALFADFAMNVTAWNVVLAVAVTAVVVVIPALPSSSSTAATFALEKLPENESYEARSARTRESLAVKYGLSAREGEVFELLAQGMTRTQIAERLALSSWTVKEYIAGVYAKLGVHSAKELMILVAGGERQEVS